MSSMRSGCNNEENETPYSSALSINIKPVPKDTTKQCGINVTTNNLHNYSVHERPSPKTKDNGITVVSGILGKISHAISSRIENFFFWYGRTIGTYPVVVILICLFLTSICALGLFAFKTEERPFKLWIPQNSDFIRIQKWVGSNFPNKYRPHIALYEANNVLDKNILLQLLNVHEVIAATEVTLHETDANNLTRKYQIGWKDVCHKLPSVVTSIFGRKKRDLSNTIHASLNEISNDFPYRYSNFTDLYKQDNHRNDSWNDLEINEYLKSLFNDTSVKEVINAHELYHLCFEASCVKNIKFHNRVKRQSFGWVSYLPTGSYCELIKQIPRECFEKSILEIWGYDRKAINALTREKIIEDVNTAEKSAIFGYPTNFSAFLGGIERNEVGKIISAKAMKQTWLTAVNFDKIIPGKFIDSFGSGVEVDEGGYRWEEAMVTNLKNLSSNAENFNLYFFSAHSFAVISGEAIESDVSMLIIGYMIVFIYVQVMLGRFNIVEARPFLSFFGLLSVPLSIVASYGICSVLGFNFNPMNNILPFLLLGLGIDDMFVIMQALNNLKESELKLDLPNRIGCALRHSGASILVTSTTDIAAFAIGSSTVLPALQSFCVFASIGIGILFFFQATYFVAGLALDQRRIENKRNTLIWCWKMNSWVPNQCSQRDLCQLFFRDIFSKILSYPIAKAIVLLATFGMLAIACWGATNLRQEFEPTWFIPRNTYLGKYFKSSREFFPTEGVSGLIYIGNVSFPKELSHIEQLVDNLKANKYVSNVNAWYSSFKSYLEEEGYEMPNADSSEEDFSYDMSGFLFSSAGSQYRESNFRFESEPVCGRSVPKIISSSIAFKYIRLYETKEKIAAMHSVKGIVRASNISGFVAPFARIHSSWETDEIIERELYKNMGLAIIVIFLMTLFLIASVVQSLYVLSCVIMTLVDVGAMMHWWGLTIDTVSCVDLVLAIGLCVDYAAHIGHTFMVCKGTRNERMRDTLSRIGPAVLNGGVSTFLAFSFLAGSNSHIFETFFKIFFGVCLFGLYHGLVYLPVLLSLIGPEPYETSLSLSESCQATIEMHNISIAQGTIPEPNSSCQEIEENKEKLVILQLLNEDSNGDGTNDILGTPEQEPLLNETSENTAEGDISTRKKVSQDRKYSSTAPVVETESQSPKLDEECNVRITKV